MVNKTYIGKKRVFLNGEEFLIVSIIANKEILLTKGFAVEESNDAVANLRAHQLIGEFQNE